MLYPSTRQKFVILRMATPECLQKAGLGTDGSAAPTEQGSAAQAVWLLIRHLSLSAYLRRTALTPGARWLRSRRSRRAAAATRSVSSILYIDIPPTNGVSFIKLVRSTQPDCITDVNWRQKDMNHYMGKLYTRSSTFCGFRAGGCRGDRRGGEC